MKELLRKKMQKLHINMGKKGQLWYSIYFAITLCLLFNPLEQNRNEITSFKRLIGPGVLQNVDVAKRVSNFSVWFLIFAITFIVIYILVGCFLSREYNSEERKVLEFISNFLVIGNINLFLQCMNYFTNESSEERSFPYITYLIMIFLLCAMGYLCFRLNKAISAENFLTLILMAFSVSFFVAAVSKQTWQSGKTLLISQIIMFAIVIISLILGKRRGRIDTIQTGLRMVTIVFSFIPFVTSFYIELINILNQHEIYIESVVEIYMLAMGGMAILAELLAGMAYKKCWKMSDWKKVTYPVLIFGISCMAVQVPLEGVYGAEMYESANFSILISDFLNYGAIPLVEHYGGHMMTGVWEGLIYALFNNDLQGAIISPYSVYITPVLAVLFFLLVRYFWNEDMALLTVLLLPFYDAWSYYGLGMLVCVAVAAYARRNTYIRAACVWLAVIWCAFYRLDLGAAFGVAAVITLFIYIIIYHNWKAILQLVITLAVWCMIGYSAWWIICDIKEIDAVERLREFLLITLSNGNWAYGSIGTMENMSFSWCYLFLPFICVICLIFVVFSKKMREEVNISKWIILLVMGFSYFANYSRGLVRHSLEETSVIMIAWTGYAFIAAYVSCVKKRKELFIIIFMCMIVGSSLLMRTNNLTEKAILDKQVAKTEYFTDTWNKGNEEGYGYWNQIADRNEPATRVTWTWDLDLEISAYELIFDTILDEDETFVDFINKSFLYSAVGRKAPSYISQSPMQLSGEEAQEMFLEEIRGVPIVLMPVSGNEWDHTDSLDGVSNSYRYYKVSEYIYKNYVPLCRYRNDFAVWCLKDRYKKMAKRIDKLKNSLGEDIAQFIPYILKIDYGYDGPTRNEDNTLSYTGIIHNQSVGYLPQIWAEYDEKNAVENEVITKLIKKNGLYVFENKTLKPDKKGNYLLLTALNDGNEDENVVIKLGKYEHGTFEEKYRYTVTMSEGLHDYLIRVSTDYYWYHGKINAVCIENENDTSEDPQIEENMKNVEMKILKGD